MKQTMECDEVDLKTHSDGKDRYEDSERLSPNATIGQSSVSGAMSRQGGRKEAPSGMESFLKRLQNHILHQSMKAPNNVDLQPDQMGEKQRVRSGKTGKDQDLVENAGRSPLAGSDGFGLSQETSPSDKQHCTDAQAKPTSETVKQIETRNRKSGVRMETFHVCIVCKQFFNKKSLLKVHMRTHTGEKPDTSKNRHKSQPRLNAPEKNKEAGKKDTSLASETAKHKSELRKNQLNTSEKKHEKTEKEQAGSASDGAKQGFLACLGCSMTFSSIEMLQAHLESEQHKKMCDGMPMKKIDETEKPSEERTKRKSSGIYCKKFHGCLVCKKLFDGPSKLRNHMRTHTGEKPFKCAICNKSYSRKDTLDGHMKKHERAGKDQSDIVYEDAKSSSLPCKDCGALFTSEDMFEKHRNGQCKKSCDATGMRNADETAMETELKATVKIEMKSTDEVEMESADDYDMGDIGEMESAGETEWQNMDETEMKNTVDAEMKNIVETEMKSTNEIEMKRTVETELKRTVETGVKSTDETEMVSANETKDHVKDITTKRNEGPGKVGGKKHPCPLCNRMFRAPCYLEIHIRTHTGEKPFVCSVCQKPFRSNGNLKEHMRVHSRKEEDEAALEKDRHKTITCPTCGKLFLSELRLKRHLKAGRCKKLFVQTQKMGEEMEIRVTNGSGIDEKMGEIAKEEMPNRQTKNCTTVTKSHSCPYCEKQFVSPSALKFHVVTHTGEKPYTCTICNKSYPRKGSLDDHMKSHYGKNPSFCCLVCGKKFCDRSSLLAHVQDHTGVKAYSCSTCDSSFKTRSSLVLHQRRHTGEKPYFCSYCGKSFASSSSFKVHLRHHTGERFSCNLCDKQFLTRGSLKTHMQVHTGEKPFVCSVCGKRVGHRGDLTIHLRVHSGEKPYVCTTCGKAFLTSANLRRHVRTHTGEKPHPCPTCGRCFADKNEIKTHMRTHTGEKPYGCSYCGRYFAQTSTLNKHLKIHTGENSYTCSVCNAKFYTRTELNTHKASHYNPQPFSGANNCMI